MDSKFKAFIVSLLRRGSFRWKPRAAAKNASRTSQYEFRGRMVWMYACKLCNGSFKGSQVVIDHIIPVVDPEKGFTNWDDYIDRMFCQSDGFQVLCESCHDKKTAEEREIRKVERKKRKSLTQA